MQTTKKSVRSSYRKFLPLIVTGLIVAVAGAALVLPSNVIAACAAPPTDNGAATSTVSVPTQTTYYMWSRVKVATAQNNSYMLEVDGGNCYNVGKNPNIALNTWTWVNYQNGVTAAPISQSLTAGTHTLKMIGTSDGVQVDRIVLTADATCVPTGTGDNCASPSVNAAPSVAITSPSNGSAASSTLSVSATANDDVSVAKVELFVDGKTTGLSDSASPYTFSLNTTSLSNGNHALTAVATDGAGLSSVSTAVNVTVSNGDTQPPVVTITKPLSGNSVSGQVAVAATATDNVGVTKQEVYIDGILKATGASATWDSTSVLNGSHAIKAVAYDAAGNNSADTVTVTVANADTTPPSTPGSPTATADAYNQITVKWSASTDNIGVTNYCITRNDGAGTCVSNSVLNYTDATVLPSTSYNYKITARDAAGNYSASSTAASATTPAAPDTAAPTVPSNVSATAASSSQINVSWSASTDNIGVRSYEVYRTGSSATDTKVCTTTATSCGDTSLTPSTSYSYYVVAIDSSNNKSAKSSIASATTLPAPVSTGSLTGVFKSGAGYPVQGTVYISYGGVSHSYATGVNGQYLATNVPAGTYNLKYSSKRTKSQTISVTVIANTTVTQDVVMGRR